MSSPIATSHGPGLDEEPLHHQARAGNTCIARSQKPAAMRNDTTTANPQLDVPPPVFVTVSLLLPRASDPWGGRGCATDARRGHVPNTAVGVKPRLARPATCARDSLLTTSTNFRPLGGGVCVTDAR